MTRALVWFRRDLRCHDHAALYHALRNHTEVYCGFVFDTDILDALPHRNDRRVAFIHASIRNLHEALKALARSQIGAPGSGLIVRHGPAVESIVDLASVLGVDEVLANHDDEPSAMVRDTQVANRLRALGIDFTTYKDHVLLERNEVLTQQGKPYSVFTPYSKAWLAKLDAFQLKPYPVAPYAHHLAKPPPGNSIPSLAALGFKRPARTVDVLPGSSGAQTQLQIFLPRLAAYHHDRDYPARAGTSGLSMHLRFGTISIRQVAGLAHAQASTGCEGARAWLMELAWRDFYQMLLWHYPSVVDHAFKPAYDVIVWSSDESRWEAWCEGRTGYPLVDAAMRQLVQTGAMHNRLRMVVASFLTKHLGIDWRRGERFFADHLNDYDLAANNGGWQWSASTGCDAQPWFRMFNPITQSERFDPDGTFLRRYLPELAKVPDAFVHFPSAMTSAEQVACGVVIGKHYPQPIVDHTAAREETRARFSAIRP